MVASLPVSAAAQPFRVSEAAPVSVTEAAVLCGCLDSTRSDSVRSGFDMAVGPGGVGAAGPAAGGEGAPVGVDRRAGDERRELVREEQRDAGDVGRGAE